MNFHVVIPARYASTRLPGKPLLLIAGKPMVIRVAERAAQSGAQQIWIATDHHAIANVVHEHGFKACLTKDTHASGTDRIAEVAEQHAWPDDTIVVNVQGDEPLIPPQLIRAVAQHLHEHPECAIATACHAIHDEDSLRNPNIVKAVLDKDGNALYFSRAPIPYPRDAGIRIALPERQDGRPSSPGEEVGRRETPITINPDNPLGRHSGEGRNPAKENILRSRQNPDFVPLLGDFLDHLDSGLRRNDLIFSNGLSGINALRHIGIYAYRVGFLRTYGQLAPAPIEMVESLEQLRALYHGYKIGVVVTDEAPPAGVDTEQDLHAARQLFEQLTHKGETK